MKPLTYFDAFAGFGGFSWEYNKRMWMYQVPRGVNKGGWTWRKAVPCMSKSLWHYNNLIALVSPKSTSTPSKTILNTSTTKTMETYRKSTGIQCPTLICSQAEVLARTLASLESGQESKESDQDLFGNTSVASKKKATLFYLGEC